MLQKREETNESCRKQREETKESCAKQRRETKEQCEYMVESARQKGEELAAVYEENCRPKQKKSRAHMDAELQKAQHQIPEDLRRDGNHDECTREESQNF